MADYELITYDGHNEKYIGKLVRLYPDGTIKDERGYWVERPANGSAELITSENARSLSRARWQKFQEAAAEAVTSEIASSVPAVTTPFAAWGVLNARTAVAIMDSDKPRGRDLEYLGRNMGAIAGPADGADDPGDVADVINAGAGFLEQLRALLADVKQGEQPLVIDND